MSGYGHGYSARSRAEALAKAAAASAYDLARSLDVPSQTQATSPSAQASSPTTFAPAGAGTSGSGGAGIVIDTGGWNAFWKKWRDTVNAIPGMKEVMLERVGREVRDEVRRAIDSSGLDDRRYGRVKLWQGPHIGTKLGYVAVRPESVLVQSGGGNRAPLNAGALTNYLTSGHKVRGPSGRWKRYRNRAEKTRVKGFGFYKSAGDRAEQIAIQAAEEFLNSLTAELTL